MPKDFRRPAVAGTFYPEDPDELSAMVNNFMDVETESPMEGRLIALVSPHAGLVYSGPVAGYGYRLLRSSSCRTFVVLAPSHREPFTGASVYDGDGYTTPLGDIPVDTDLVTSIVDASDYAERSSIGHSSEHSLEVQLPFLQEAIKEDFQLVPIVVGDMSLEMAEEFAGKLADVLEPVDAVMIASTDLSHFHSQEAANALDSRVAQLIEEYDPETLYKACITGECEACGINPLVTVMIAAKKLGAEKARILKYTTSGDITGEYAGVVGYLSATITA